MAAVHEQDVEALIGNFRQKGEEMGLDVDIEKSKFKGNFSKDGCVTITIRKRAAERFGKPSTNSFNKRKKISTVETPELPDVVSKFFDSSDEQKVALAKTYRHGDYVSLDKLAPLLGYRTQSSLRKPVEENRIIYKEVGVNKNKRFPTWQVFDEQFLPGLEVIIEALGDNKKKAILFFTQEHKELGFQCPIDLLILRGESVINDVVECAKSFKG